MKIYALFFDGELKYIYKHKKDLKKYIKKNKSKYYEGCFYYSKMKLIK